MEDTLFVIGNGFDAYMHGLPTKYADFRSYLYDNYDISNRFISIPSSTMMPDGDENYDQNEVCSYICQTLDMCGGPDWKDLETYLGRNAFDELSGEFIDIDFEDDHFMRDVYNNEDIADDMSRVFAEVKYRFCEWVNNCIINVPKACIKNEEYAKILSTGSLFLDFNYSRVLEEVYNIPDEKICHIHGVCGMPNDEIVFGHGSLSDYENPNHIEVEMALNDLKRILRKDVQGVIGKNWNFFNKIKNVSKIYSAGFSFGDVDRPYVETIYEKVKQNSPVWYFTNYDWNRNPKCVEYVNSVGFKTKASDLW